MIEPMQTSLPRTSSASAHSDVALAACRGVSVRYGQAEAEVAALTDINFTLGQNERVALWGRSGSGKTTLLHVLGGLVTPSTGVVEWKGEPLASRPAIVFALDDRRIGVSSVAGKFQHRGSSLRSIRAREVSWF